ncbi:MAG: hypothetical protein IKB07_02685 [Lachnospiraceae bacterium]|nr:hypothetical protein [Lachnospiraceae bacterium]
MKEKEIRTPKLNLLFCKVIVTAEKKIVLELKNGKRMEQVPIERFLAEIEDFTKGDIPKLDICSRVTWTS